jgi:hypothetical protein
VVVYFASTHASLAEIVIENFGEGSAADVKCVFTPPLQSTMGSDPAKFFDSPKWLPPRSRLTHAFDSWMHYIPSNLPKQYSVAVTFRDLSLEKVFTLTYQLDAAAFEHVMSWERRDIHDVAGTLKELVNKLDRRLGAREQREARRDKIWQATPAPIALGNAIAMIIGLWRQFRAIDESTTSYAFSADFFPSMRKATSSALVAAILEGCTESQKAALDALYASLHTHDFELMTDQRPALEAVKTALVGVVTEWPDTLALKAEA